MLRNETCRGWQSCQIRLKKEKNTLVPLISIENVQTGSLSAYKIPGTPTVLIVDNRGTVKSIWIGAVTGHEKEIRDELVALFAAPVPNETSARVDTPNKVGDTSGAPAATDLEAAELKNLVEVKRPIIIIDVDERTEFKKGHIPQARNIPVDEMASRAPREVPKNGLVVLYCRCSGSSAADGAKAGLREQGYTQIAVLKGGMDSWKKLGMAITPSEK